MDFKLREVKSGKRHLEFTRKTPECAHWHLHLRPISVHLNKIPVSILENFPKRFCNKSNSLTQNQTFNHPVTNG